MKKISPSPHPHITKKLSHLFEITPWPSLFDMHIKLHTFSTSMNLLPIVPSIYEEVLIESREGKVGSTVLLIVVVEFLDPTYIVVICLSTKVMRKISVKTHVFIIIIVSRYHG